jgi:predicted anti-sigma-YlaC factor YlaD
MSGARDLTCEEALSFLAAYLDHELEGATDGDVENHLARCRSCYSRADFERRLKGQLSSLGRSAVRPEFAERIQKLLTAFPAAPPTPES